MGLVKETIFTTKIPAAQFPPEKACSCSVLLFLPSSFLHFSESHATYYSNDLHVIFYLMINVKTGKTTITHTTTTDSLWGDTADGQFSHTSPSLSPTFSPSLQSDPSITPAH